MRFLLSDDIRCLPPDTQSSLALLCKHREAGYTSTCWITRMISVTCMLGKSKCNVFVIVIYSTGFLISTTNSSVLGRISD